VDFLHQFLGRLYRKRTNGRLKAHLADARKGKPACDMRRRTADSRDLAQWSRKFARFDSQPIRFEANPLRSGVQTLMRLPKTLFALLALVLFIGQTQLANGPQGAEAEPNREQPWLVPTPMADRAAHAVLYRPPGDGPFHLAVVAHATTQNVLRRAQMPQPEYRALAAFFVARGFAVLVPERLGHGGTGGAYLEDQGGCDEADYAHSGRATADQILLALQFLQKQPFIRPEGAVLIGHSGGGWGALALADEGPKVVSAIIAFAPGRGGHANDFENRICAPHTLIAAAETFGKAARVPVTWLVAANDTYFSPEFSKRLVDAFGAGGARVDFHLLPAFDGEGHWLPESESGVKLAASELDRALRGQATAARKR
jgi:dienelactone hydrolase